MSENLSKMGLFNDKVKIKADDYWAYLNKIDSLRKENRLLKNQIDTNILISEEKTKKTISNVVALKTLEDIKKFTESLRGTVAEKIKLEIEINPYNKDQKYEYLCLLEKLSIVLYVE